METQVLTKEQALDACSKNEPKRDYIIELGVKGTQLVEDDGLRLQHGKRSYSLSNVAMGSLMKSVNLPSTLYHKISDYPDLVAYIVNYFASRNNIVKKMFVRDGLVLGFTSPDQFVIPNAQIIENLDKNIPEIRFDQLYEYPKGVANFHCFTGNGNKFEVAKDDYFKYGVKVSNSPIGLVRPTVGAYAVRLVCTNGAVSVDDIWHAPGKYEPGWLQSSIKSAKKVSTNFFEKIKALNGAKIDREHLDEVLESIYGDLSVPLGVRDYITRRVMKHGAENMYDLFNHITYIGSHYSVARENPRLISRLMDVGGAMVNHNETCPTCHHLVKSN